MTSQVGDDPKELDWGIYPGRGIVGRFQAIQDGVEWAWPDGLSAWLEVVDPDACGKVSRYNFEITGSLIVVRISREEAARIKDRSKFRVYLLFPGEPEPLFWASGKGVRTGW